MLTTNNLAARDRGAEMIEKKGAGGQKKRNERICINRRRAIAVEQWGRRESRRDDLAGRKVGRTYMTVRMKDWI